MAGVMDGLPFLSTGTDTLDTPAFGRRWRTEAVGYLDLGPVIFLPLAKRDRLHGQPDELLMLSKRFGRIFFDPGQAPPDR